MILIHTRVRYLKIGMYLVFFSITIYYSSYSYNYFFRTFNIFVVSRLVIISVSLLSSINFLVPIRGKRYVGCELLAQMGFA